MKKLTLTLPYFGDLNRSGHFELFLTSCKFNETVNFLIITDDKKEYSYPPNVRVCYTSFSDFAARIRSNFDFDIALDHAYKLCDLRTAFGEILSDELAGSDFWGYMDCDLILGDIRSFITDEKLNKYDKLYTRGHLTFIRNTKEINTLYKKIIPGVNTDYKKAFSSGASFCFDEWGNGGGLNRIFMKNGAKLYNELDFDDISMRRKAFFPEQVCKNAPYNKIKNVCYVYKNGQLIRHSMFFDEMLTESVIYAHFQKRRMTNNVDSKKADSFIIIPDSFENYRLVTPEFLSSLPTDGIRWEFHKMRVKNKLNRILK